MSEIRELSPYESGLCLEAALGRIKKMEAEWAWIEENKVDLYPNADGPGWEVAVFVIRVDREDQLWDIIAIAETPREAIQLAMNRQQIANSENGTDEKSS
jgi:uncharacterized protein (UPF0335 family)